MGGPGRPRALSWQSPASRPTFPLGMSGPTTMPPIEDQRRLPSRTRGRAHSRSLITNSLVTPSPNVGPLPTCRPAYGGWSQGGADGRRWSASAQVDERTPGDIRTCINRAAKVRRKMQRTSRLGFREARIYVDHGSSGSNRHRPGLRLALGAVELATLWW